MGLYFPKAEMPNSCGECRCSGTDVCREWMTLDRSELGTQRSKNCPAVYIAPHGDLIDREQLIIDLCLDESVEIVARTKLINEYIAEKLETAAVVIHREKDGRTE